VNARPLYPFTALVAQDRLKRALLLNAVNPRLGGVLIRGEKGTAKSTAVRALAVLLPELDVVADCPYGCDPSDRQSACESCRERSEPPTGRKRVPVVQLPVGATEDRVVGTLDLEHAIQRGERRFEPGLLADANRGILYVDEVNLLNDHLVDLLLDAAAMGVNYVEREGVSVEHPSQFILVGTMNPEEGDLRPQLLDRFALAVEVEGLDDPAERAEVVRRRVAFEADPRGFAARWAEAEQAERERIVAAQRLLPDVRLDDRMLDLITRLCLDFEVDGMRADIVMYRAALTLAAYEGRRLVDEGDIRAAAELALLHRRRRQPFEQPGLDRERLDERIREHLDQSDPSPSPDDGSPDDGSPDDGSPPSSPPPSSGSPPPDESSPPPDSRPPTPESQFADSQPPNPDPFAVAPLPVRASRQLREPRQGRRGKGRGKPFQGYEVGAELPGERPRDLALGATLRAAAPSQPRRRAVPGSKARPALLLQPPDLRTRVRESRVGSLILFVVDASGSMAARQRMEAARGAVMSLLLDAYRKRDRVGLIAFRGRGAELLLPPTNSVDLAHRQLVNLPTGGRTPLGHGLQLGLATVERHLALRRDVLPLLVLVSDGRANVSLRGGPPMAELPLLGEALRRSQVQTLVVDADQSKVRFGFAAQVATALGATHLTVDQLAAGTLAGAARSSLPSQRRGWA
jgi:magnesium chelatase subunit D